MGGEDSTYLVSSALLMTLEVQARGSGRCKLL
jgi:hypothetical protein